MQLYTSLIALAVIAQPSGSGPGHRDPRTLEGVARERRSSHRNGNRVPTVVRSDEFEDGATGNAGQNRDPPVNHTHILTVWTVHESKG